ncbi:MAG: hypothetical protein ACLRFN_03585 [Alphaproteobacteria bacterium]
MTDMITKFNTGMENVNSMSMNKAANLKKGMETIDLAKIFGKRGVTCG